MPDKHTGRVRIIKPPDGEAELWVREAWLLCPALPCCPYLGFPDDGLERGVLSGVERQVSRPGVGVPQVEAIQILSVYHLQAARYWKEHGFPHVGKYFGFEEECIEIISGVTRQEIIQVQDDDSGNPFR